MLKELINREITSRQETLVGTVVGSLELVAFDGSVNGGETWTTNVDVGGRRILRNVPVKALNGSREYARLGKAVLLTKNQGRYEITGTADRVIGAEITRTYNLNTFLNTGQAQGGFTAERPPFEFYQGDQAMKGNPLVSFAGMTITRAVGSFLDDGFPQTGTLQVGKQSINAGTYTLASVTATVITISGATFTTESNVAKVSIGVTGTSRWNDSLTSFPLIIVRDGAGNIV